VAKEDTSGFLLGNPGSIPSAPAINEIAISILMALESR